MDTTSKILATYKNYPLASAGGFILGYYGSKLLIKNKLARAGIGLVTALIVSGLEVKRKHYASKY